MVNKRVVIVDFNHQVHTYFHSNHRLSAPIIVNGKVVEKDTTIQNGCIKNVHRWSNHGTNPMAICFDRPVPARKAFWQSVFPEMSLGSGKEYKGNREKMPDAMFEGISDCEKLLRMAGVSCFAYKNYEADDLVFACVQRAKEKYPDLPIDVITNDADLLPLVDERVSVFLRSRKLTWAEDKSIEKAHYVQVTKKNFETVVGDLSAYRGFYLPYNTILLHKLLRGDSSDNFVRKEISRKFPKTKFNDMMLRMVEDNRNVDDIFKYGKPQYEIYNKVTKEVFNGTMEEAKKSPDKANFRMRVKNSEELDLILTLMSMYTDMTDEQLEIVKNVYLGMNLNQPYVNADKNLCRHEYRVGVTESTDIDVFSEIELQRCLEPLKIRLNIY